MPPGTPPLCAAQSGTEAFRSAAQRRADAESPISQPARALRRLSITDETREARIKAIPMLPVTISGISMKVASSIIDASEPIAQYAPWVR